METTLPDNLHCRQWFGNVERHCRHPEEEGDEGVVDDVPESLAGVWAQEVLGVIAEEEVVGYRKQKIADEDID